MRKEIFEKCLFIWWKTLTMKLESKENRQWWMWQHYCQCSPKYFPHILVPHLFLQKATTIHTHIVATLALGLRPRQRELQGCGPRGSPGVSQEEAWELSQEEAWELSQEEARESKQKEARESHHILPGVQESARECEGVDTHTPKATPTWGDGVPVDSRNFRERLQGSNLNVLWRSLYHWKALGA